MFKNSIPKTKQPQKFHPTISFSRNVKIFQDTLQQMRKIDDKIVYLLNCILPTESFRGQIDPNQQCKDLYKQIEQGRTQREHLITSCLNSTINNVKRLKNEQDSEQNDTMILKNLRKEQNKVRLLQSELSVEEVVKQRTDKIYNEKCRSYFKPNKWDVPVH